jgi:hypothetical protein
VHGKTRGKDDPENPRSKALRREKSGKEARQDPIRELLDTIAKGDILRAKATVAVKDTNQAKAGAKAVHTKAVKGDTLHVKAPLEAKAATKKGDIPPAKAPPDVKKGRGHPTRAAKGGILHAKAPPDVRREVKGGTPHASDANSAARREKADTRSLRSRTTGADTTAR